MRNFGGHKGHKESLSDLGGRILEATTSDPWKPSRSPSEIRPARLDDAASRCAVYRQRTGRRGEGPDPGRPAKGRCGRVGVPAWRPSFDGPWLPGGGGGSSQGLRSTSVSELERPAVEEWTSRRLLRGRPADPAHRLPYENGTIFERTVTCIKTSVVAPATPTPPLQDVESAGLLSLTWPDNGGAPAAVTSVILAVTFDDQWEWAKLQPRSVTGVRCSRRAGPASRPRCAPGWWVLAAGGVPGSGSGCGGRLFA